MTRRAWLLVSAAYLLLAVGVGISLWLIADQADTNERAANRLTVAVAILCEIALTPTDQAEDELLNLIAFADDEEVTAALQLSPTCRAFTARVGGADVP